MGMIRHYWWEFRHWRMREQGLGHSRADRIPPEEGIAKGGTANLRLFRFLTFFLSLSHFPLSPNSHLLLYFFPFNLPLNHLPPPSPLILYLSFPIVKRKLQNRALPGLIPLSLSLAICTYPRPPNLIQSFINLTSQPQTCDTLAKYLVLTLTFTD